MLSFTGFNFNIGSQIKFGVDLNEWGVSYLSSLYEHILSSKKRTDITIWTPYRISNEEEEYTKKSKKCREPGHDIEDQPGFEF